MKNDLEADQRVVAEPFRVPIKQGDTYLLRIVNAALQSALFFKIAGHEFIVVAVDASYTKHYRTDVIIVAPGQTTYALLTTNQAWHLTEIFKQKQKIAKIRN